MMKNQGGILHSRILKVIILMIFVVFCYVVRFDFYYDLNDDTTIKDILSGAYTGTPSGYSIQMLYPLGAFIALFYRAIPGLSWYGLFLCLCQFGSLALIAYRITGLFENEKKQILALCSTAIIVLGVLFEQFVIIQYSVTSGMCMMAAIFLFVTSKSSQLKDNIIPVILVVLSFQIRTELCLMLMPFLLLAGFAKWMLDLKNTKNYVIIIMTAIVGMAIFYAGDLLAVSANAQSAQWKEFKQLFDDRTKLYDFYELPDYDSNHDFFESINMTKESYELFKNYNYSLDDSITSETFSKIANYREPQLKETPLILGKKIYTKNNIKEAIWLYKQQLLHPTLLGGFTIIVYVGFFLLSSLKKKSGCIWKFLLLVGCRSCIWIYLYMVDRMVDRIIIPLYIAELTLLLSWIIYDQLYVDVNDKKYRKVYYGMIVVYSLVLLISSIKLTVSDYEARQAINPRWEKLMDYCRSQSGNYYLIDVYSSTSYDGVPYSEKVFADVDNPYKNFDICGGWVAKSPLTNQKLRETGISSIEESLVSGENVRFVVSIDRMGPENMKWLVDYYKSKDVEINLVEDNFISNENEKMFVVYRLEKK